MPPVPLLSKVAGPTTVTSEGDSAFNPANWLELAEQPTSVTARLLLRVNPLLVELVTIRPYRNTPSDSLTVTLPMMFAVDPYHAPMLMLKALFELVGTMIEDPDAFRSDIREQLLELADTVPLAPMVAIREKKARTFVKEAVGNLLINQRTNCIRAN